MAATSSGAANLLGDTPSQPDPDTAVQACIDLSGPTDFLRLGPGHDPAASPESQLMGFLHAGGRGRDPVPGAQVRAR